MSELESIILRAEAAGWSLLGVFVARNRPDGSTEVAHIYSKSVTPVLEEIVENIFRTGEGQPLERLGGIQ